MFKEKITIISTIVTTLSAVLILWERLYNLPPYLMILFIILTIASFTLIFAKKESSLSKKVVYFFCGFVCCSSVFGVVGDGQ